MSSFLEYLQGVRAQIDATLDRLLPAAATAPQRIHRAMRYSVLGDGKRLRPALTVLAGETCGGKRAQLLEAAAAAEMIHAFSLVHDDLPALDDDDLRRGRPTVHREFDEALAVLVGDALLNLGLQTLAGYPCDLPAESRLWNVTLVCEAVGTAGMIGGQVADLEASGAMPDNAMVHLETIHRRKTGALLSASLQVGMVCARGGAELETVLLDLGATLGLMFQIRDDILDVEGESSELGKTAGKDELADKLTYPSVYGLEESKRILEEEWKKGLSVVQKLPRNQHLFEDLLRYVASRSS